MCIYIYINTMCVYIYICSSVPNPPNGITPPPHHRHRGEADTITTLQGGGGQYYGWPMTMSQGGLERWTICNVYIYIYIYIYIYLSWTHWTLSSQSPCKQNQNNWASKVSGSSKSEVCKRYTSCTCFGKRKQENHGTHGDLEGYNWYI